VPRPSWNHNIHYHPVVLRSVPPGCRLALDVGCGEGLLARKLAPHCDQVIALDIDGETLALARAHHQPDSRIRFVQGNVMTYPLGEDSFDLITAVAALHHLPLRPALARFQNLLRSGGVLAILGLYRTQTLADYTAAAAAFPVSWMLRCFRRHEEVRAPLLDPKETFDEIRSVGQDILPGAVFRRHLLFRYSLIWRKPSV
jgi:SAM-dependent methyltransferase